MKKIITLWMFSCLIHSNNVYAADVSNFDAKVYSTPNLYELKQNHPFIAYGVMAFREDYKAHMWHVLSDKKYSILSLWNIA